jgi:hypothetical protein
MDGRAHPAEAGKARTTKVERHRDQRHLARRSGGGKGHAIEITTDRAGNGNIIGEQQINLIRRDAVTARSAMRVWKRPPVSVGRVMVGAINWPTRSVPLAASPRSETLSSRSAGAATVLSIRLLPLIC